MFESGHDQAAGLRAAASHRTGPTMISVASPAQPARAYEMLCRLAAQLLRAGHTPVILDGTSSEAQGRDGSHLGLMHALTDAAVSGIGQPAEGHEWLVMPAALGLHALQQTALTAGGNVALSRLLSPFAQGTLLLLFAPAHELAPLSGALSARVMVPVLAWPQASIDAYGALKLLHMSGAVPVLAPLEEDESQGAVQTVLHTVTDCAQRHLGIETERWSERVWASCVLESASGRPQRVDTAHGLRDPRLAGPGSAFSGVVPQLWS